MTALLCAMLQRVTALLAFTAETQCEPYKALFADDQWESLVELFRYELYRLNSLTPQSLLDMHLQVGLSIIMLPADRC
jgi:macrophage erythroblast attacher